MNAFEYDRAVKNGDIDPMRFEPLPVVEPPPNYGNRGMPTVAQTIETLLETRHSTHGSFAHNARIGQHLRAFFRNQPGWLAMDERGREALDYLAGKLSRILSGKSLPEHWEDIAGYAKLACHEDLQR